MSSAEVASSIQDSPTPEFCLAWLIMNSPQWVHRRVEALRMQENGKSRWHISHDITLPEWSSIPGSKDRMIVPLGSVRKGALKNVDTSGAGASSLSILGAEDNGNYAVAMLRMLAQSLLGEELGGSARCRDVVTAVVRATTESCDASTNEFSVWLADCLELVADEDKGAEFDRSVDLFREFVLQFATTFLLLVEVNDVSCNFKLTSDGNLD